MDESGIDAQCECALGRYMCDLMVRCCLLRRQRVSNTSTLFDVDLCKLLEIKFDINIIKNQ